VLNSRRIAVTSDPSCRENVSLLKTRLSQPIALCEVIAYWGRSWSDAWILFGHSAPRFGRARELALRSRAATSNRRVESASATAAADGDDGSSGSCSRDSGELAASLQVVRPETVVRWHRRGFRLYWAWKSRRRWGRPAIGRACGSDTADAARIRCGVRQGSTASC